MGKQNAPSGVAREAFDGKEVVEFADEIFERPNVRTSPHIEKTHAQSNFIVAQSLRDERGALFLDVRKLVL